MAKDATTFSTYEAIGNREDLSNAIYDISPMETPVVSMIPRVKATGRLHEWQTDSLAAAAANAQIEGDEISIQASPATTRVSNVCQILSKALSVSRTQRVVDTAGRADEYDYQIAKRGKELKRDIEFAVTQNGESTLASSATARTMAGMESWLQSTTANAAAPYTSLFASVGNVHTSPGFTSGSVTAPTDSTDQGVLTSTTGEAALKSVIRQAWTNGGNPEVVLTGPFNKQKISAFGGIATQYRDNQQVGPGVIIAAADIYVSDYGQHKIVPSRFNRDRTVMVLDMDYWALAELDPIEVIPLAKTGDADKAFMVTELTLESRQSLASGKIVDLTTS